MDGHLVIHDKTFQKYITEEEINRRITEIGQAIHEEIVDLEKIPVFLGVLVGAFRFTADLLTVLDAPVVMDFVKMRSYEGTTSTGKIKQMVGIDSDLTNRHVYVVEDIVDTGHTMNQVRKQLMDLGAKRVHIISMFFKPNAFIYDFPIDHVGFEIPNDFIVGYGLDYDGLGRELNAIYQVVESRE